MNYRRLTLAVATMIFSLSMAASTAAVAPLVDAAARGDLDTVRYLLRDGADVNEAQGDGMTALHWAAERGDAELADMLIYAGCNLEGGTRIGHYTPLHIASRNGNTNIVTLLLAAGADASATTTNSGVMPIHLAAASGSAESALTLLEAGADVNATESSWGQTPLIFAASANRADVIRVLVNAGGDISSTSRSIDTADMEEADKAAEKRLAEFLADFKAKEGGGPNWQPQPSQVQAAIEASREIQRKWPDVPDPSCDDYVAEEDGAENKCANPVTYNADGEPVDGYDVGKKDADEPRPATYGQQVGSWGGLAPLHHAVRQGHTDAVLALLDAGADINQPIVGDQSSPLLVAAINGQFDMAMMLLERGADPNHSSVVGTTPLFATLERQWAPRASYSHPTEHQQQKTTHIELIQALLEAGADPNVRLAERLWFTEYTFAVLGAAGVHYKGATPFWRAAHALDLDAMTLLKEYGANSDMPTVKLPPRRRRTPDPQEQQIKTGDSKKTTTVASSAAAQKNDDKKDEDHSGLPPVPVGGPFIHPIHVAAGAGYGQQFAGNAHRYVPGNWLEAVRFLVEECGADVNLRDANGYTALHHAASRGDNELVQYLIDQGADVMVVSRKGQTTVDMANGPIQRLSPFPETIALLESYGARNNNNCVSC
jgi:ankyrin repeat protein